MSFESPQNRSLRDNIQRLREIQDNTRKLAMEILWTEMERDVRTMPDMSDRSDDINWWEKTVPIDTLKSEHALMVAAGDWKSACLMAAKIHLRLRASEGSEGVIFNPSI